MTKRERELDFSTIFNNANVFDGENTKYKYHKVDLYDIELSLKNVYAFIKSKLYDRALITLDKVMKIDPFNIFAYQFYIYI